MHPPELLETLKQRDMYSVGETESFYAGWKHMAKAEKSYNEIVDMSSIGYRRSDITTDSSMKLYSSFFDQSSEISPVRTRLSCVHSFFVYDSLGQKKLTHVLHSSNLQVGTSVRNRGETSF